MNISVIIPVLNEASNIEKTLNHILSVSKQKETLEIIIVDGGSTDNTKQIIELFPEVKYVLSIRGRSQQMNFGTQKATGDILYFLHADSLPPIHFDTHILKAISQQHKAGCFKMKFDSNHPWLKLAGWFTKFNLKFFRGGDQSLFITKRLFKSLEGFDNDAVLFEDYLFIRKLYSNRTFHVIQKNIITSSRRYKENGIANLQYHYWVLYLKKWMGANSTELKKYYRNHIK